MSAIIIRKIYLRKKQERIEKRLQESLENARRQRRQQSRPAPRELRDDEKCVVCVENPKEVSTLRWINHSDRKKNMKKMMFSFIIIQVICLPCGHVCLCEDCSAKIKLSCPVCRGRIDNKSAAYIS